VTESGDSIIESGDSATESVNKMTEATASATESVSKRVESGASARKSTCGNVAHFGGKAEAARPLSGAGKATDAGGASIKESVSTRRESTASVRAITRLSRKLTAKQTKHSARL